MLSCGIDISGQDLMAWSPVGQHYEVTVTAHCHKSVLALIWCYILLVCKTTMGNKHYLYVGVLLSTRDRPQCPGPCWGRSLLGPVPVGSGAFWDQPLLGYSLHTDTGLQGVSDRRSRRAGLRLMGRWQDFRAGKPVGR